MHGDVGLVEVELVGVGHLVDDELNLVEDQGVLVLGVLVQVGQDRHEEAVEEEDLVPGWDEGNQSYGVGHLVQGAGRLLERDCHCCLLVHGLLGYVQVLPDHVVGGQVLVLGDVVVVQVALDRGLKPVG